MQQNQATIPFTREQQDFLEALPRAKEGDRGIPIYIRQPDGSFAFLQGYNMATSANRQFERTAPQGLYRGGVVILVRMHDHILVVPDDRYQWFKPFAGIACYDEGEDLCLSGMRELIEEAFIYDLKKTTRYVPNDVSSSVPISRSSSLGFEVGSLMSHGHVTQKGVAVNDTNKAYEAVVEWDISGIEVPFSIALEEEWWAKHWSGVSVYAMNRHTGAIEGVYSGQQGFLELPKLGIHPTLKAELGTS